MSNTSLFSNQYVSRTMRTLLLTLGAIFMYMATIVSAAPPIGQTIWIRSSGTNRFVSADQNRGAFAPLVADRTSVGAFEQFQVVDAGGGFIALRSIANGRFVSADLNRGAFAPLVADRTSASTWEHFIWTDLPGGAFTLRGRVTGLFVCADQNRGAFAPLVSDRAVASTWETFTWGTGAATPTPTPTPNPGGAPPGFPNLVWSDEFNGSTINTSNWTYDLGNSGFGNNELQNYTNRPVNARQEGGQLIIEARRESLGGSQFTSARLKTQDRRSFGVNTWVEARIQLPQGQGIWPAFWMLGNSISTIGWPSCGEIDILEVRGQNPFQLIGTMHWANDNGTHAQFGTSINTPVSLAAGFHTYAIARTPTSIRWFLDGVQYHEANIAGGINSTQEFQAQFFIILNVAVGGNFVGSPNDSTPFPQQMRVDYVRVFGQ
jgi:hypothetical protein